MQYWLRKRHEYRVVPDYARDGNYALYNATTGGRVCEVRKEGPFWFLPSPFNLYRTREEIIERAPLLETYWSEDNGDL